MLQDRIIYLIKIEKIDETFLISSLVSYITEIFDNNVKALIAEVQMQEKIIQGNSKNSKYYNMYNKLRSEDYKNNTKNDYYRWKKIISANFSEEKFERWEQELIIENNKLVKEHYD